MDSQKYQHFLTRLTRFIKGSNATGNREAFDLLFDFYSKKKHAKEKFTAAEKERLEKELFQRISRTLDLDGQSRVQPVRPRHRSFSRVWRVAAVLAMAVMLAGAGYRWAPEIKQSVTVLLQVEKTVEPGNRQQYTLPDGTRVWLNAGSTLIYPRFFLGRTREVTLSGEAFFQVTRRPKQPFMILTDDITTQVLGTTFNVKAYKEFRHAVITVATGRVQVSKDDQVLSTLAANQEISIDKQSGKFKLSGKVETASRLAWQAGRLIFDNTPMDEVLATLSNYYAVGFDTVQVNLSGQYLTAEFGADASLREVLGVIIQINKLNFSGNGNTVVVSGQKEN